MEFMAHYLINKLADLVILDKISCSVIQSISDLEHLNELLRAQFYCRAREVDSMNFVGFVGRPLTHIS